MTWDLSVGMVLSFEQEQEFEETYSFCMLVTIPSMNSG